MSRSVTVRAYQPRDEGVLLGLWNAVMTRDPVAPGAFRRRTLGDPNFDPVGCSLAERDGVPAGFAIAVPPGTPHRFANESGTGRIAALGVLPEHRRHGLGTALLEEALAFLGSRGCGRVSVAAHEHFMPGVDRDVHADGIAFLRRREFRETGGAVGMGRLLFDLAWPPEAREAEARLLQSGVRIRGYEPGDDDAVEAFFRADFPSWGEFFRETREKGGAAEDVVLACAGHHVIGFCQRLEADHVGPFGVAADFRGRGVGTVMLYRLLEGVRACGYRFVWFGETGRARPYYERAGFSVTRRYALLERTLRALPPGVS